MSLANENNRLDRRKFINKAVRYSISIGICGVGAVLAGRASKEELVWQLDPAKCVQCGRCATNCVLTPSAVKCIHGEAHRGMVVCVVGRIRGCAGAAAPFRRPRNHRESHEKGVVAPACCRMNTSRL